MINSISTNKKGIYKDLYRTIEADKKKENQQDINIQTRERKGIYKDLYRTIESDNVSFKANEKSKDNKEESIWHTYPLKACAYSNDIREAIRPIIGAFFAKLSWLPAIFYVIGAIISKLLGSTSQDKSKELSKEILFQLIASLLLPILLVKSVCKATHKVLDALPAKSKDFIKNSVQKIDWLHKFGENFKSEKMSQYRAVCESTVGLFALAVAVRPIDHYTEKALDMAYSKG